MPSARFDSKGSVCLLTVWIGHEAQLSASRKITLVGQRRSPTALAQVEVDKAPLDFPQDSFARGNRRAFFDVAAE